ncbi:DUF47 family protein [Candidatus Bathyarchaeota archaeon]|nr:DUF47 family protein [Candidatus Bathyarchaeota archaeon]
MATRKLLLWFERRRKSKTLDLAQEQIIKAINTVNELEKALISLSNSEKKEVEAAIQRLFAQEVEIDDLRRTVFKELSEDGLPAKYREDLKDLVGHLDVMADNVKDSARSVKVLMETTVPREILDEYVKTAQYLSACALALGDCIEMLGLNPAMVRELAEKVDAFEEKVDEEDMRIKLLLIQHSSTVDAATLLELGDLLNHMEHAADRCSDTAEYIRILAAEETTR